MRQVGMVTRTCETVAWVKMEKGATCGGKDCPMSFSWIDDPRSDFYVVKAQNDIGASQGDMVLVELHDATVLFVAFLLYIVPIFVALASYLILRLFLHSFPLLFLGILGSVGTVVLFVRRFDRSFVPGYRIVEFWDSEGCSPCPLKKEL